MAAAELFRDLYRHMEWADAVLWRAILASPAAAADPRTKDLVFHIHLVQRAFIRIWRGDALTTPKLSASSDTAAVMAWAREYHADAPAFLSTLTDADLDRPVHLPWADRFAKQLNRPVSDPTLRETMTQIPMHSTHHRGQVLMRLRELGAEPPLTDFIAWVWFGKPAPQWPELESA